MEDYIFDIMSEEDDDVSAKRKYPWYAYVWDSIVWVWNHFIYYIGDFILILKGWMIVFKRRKYLRKMAKENPEIFYHWYMILINTLMEEEYPKWVIKLALNWY